MEEHWEVADDLEAYCVHKEVASAGIAVVVAEGHTEVADCKVEEHNLGDNSGQAIAEAVGYAALAVAEDRDAADHATGHVEEGHVVHSATVDLHNHPRDHDRGEHLVELGDLYTELDAAVHWDRYILVVVLDPVEDHCTHFDVGREQHGNHLDLLVHHLGRLEEVRHPVPADIAAAARTDTEPVAVDSEEDRLGEEAEGESCIAERQPLEIHLRYVSTQQ